MTRWKALAFQGLSMSEPSPGLRPLTRAARDLSHLRGRGAGDYSSGTSSSATMLMILISGLMAGPAVSL